MNKKSVIALVFVLLVALGALLIYLFYFRQNNKSIDTGEVIEEIVPDQITLTNEQIISIMNDNVTSNGWYDIHYFCDFTDQGNLHCRNSSGENAVYRSGMTPIWANLKFYERTEYSPYLSDMERGLDGLISVLENPDRSLQIRSFYCSVMDDIIKSPLTTATQKEKATRICTEASYEYPISFAMDEYEEIHSEDPLVLETQKFERINSIIATVNNNSTHTRIANYEIQDKSFSDIILMSVLEGFYLNEYKNSQQNEEDLIIGFLYIVDHFFAAPEEYNLSTYCLVRANAKNLESLGVTALNDKYMNDIFEKVKTNTSESLDYAVCGYLNNKTNMMNQSLLTSGLENEKDSLYTITLPAILDNSVSLLVGLGV